MADLNKTFIREIEVLSTALEIHQAMVGDVGCVVWDAAIVLAKYLEKTREENLKRKTILELGAGTGIVGICCSFMGANVICTDLKDLIPLLELNKKVNKTHLKGDFKVLELKWGEKISSQLQPLDYLIMSDVIYYAESLEPLVKSICDLADEKTEVLMSYEERFDGDKPFLEKRFFELIGKCFTWNKIPMEQQDTRFQSGDIHIISMRKKS